ncbi:MAG: D-alanyl-D-alanine carboxypeptidase [Armatimonadetes bacterium]|nr:D-alanyl-D-alanine carboxypeptidase [Armatimonadota bacterium]
MCRSARIFLLWLCLAAAAGADLSGELDALAGDGPSRSLSYLFVRCRDGEVLASREPDRLLVPASTLKILGAAVILEAAPERLVTRVRASGPIDEGVLRGSLVLEGGWDPELSRRDVEGLAASLRAAGLRRVAGPLGFDGGPGDPFLGPGWSWEDAPYVYTPALGALRVDRGEIPIPPSSGDGDRTLIRRPGIPGTEVTGSSPEPVCMTDPDPAATAGSVFRQALEAAGIQVDGPTLRLEARGEIVAAHSSRPVIDLLSEGLAHSDNLILESLYRRAGGGAPKELPPDSLRMVDGCGLSRYNLISVRQLVLVLRARAGFRELLPRPGLAGTLERRFADSAARELLAAKTGTMSTVSGLAGYLFPGSQEEIAFAILLNGHLGPMAPAKELEERMVERVVTRIRWPYLR